MKMKIRDLKTYRRKRRHMHIRNSVTGTAERPRICVFRSNSHIYAQVIDDTQGKTLFSVSSLKVDASAAAAPAESKDDDGKKKKKKTPPASGKILQAKAVGKLLAETAKEKGITKVCFDRGGYLYHGRIAALAGAAREAGLEF